MCCSPFVSPLYVRKHVAHNIIISARESLLVFLCFVTQSGGVVVAQWLEHQTVDRKVTGLSPCRSSRKILFTRVNFLCADSYFGIHSTPMLTQ